MKRRYHTINKQGKVNEANLAEFLSKNGQLLLPMVDLIEQCQWACDELIEVTGRAAIQAVLQLSAEQVAGGRGNTENVVPVRWSSTANSRAW